MHHSYIALCIYYAIPAIATGLCRWWKTDLIMGTNGAYWDARFDIRGIAESLVYAALWPIAGFFVVRSFYLRWPVGEALSKALDERDAQITQLEIELAQLRNHEPNITATPKNK